MTVSICMITYNHEDYIVEAIESVLKQATSFSVEFIIGEDKSTDRTREICKDYEKKYPHIIKLLPAESNLGMTKNFIRTWQACTGKYIAFIEGDDYWTDPLKLQKQIDFLETNNDYSACFHNVQMKLERNKEEREWILHKDLGKDSFETEDVLGPWFIPSPSFVFVNYADLILPDWFYFCKYGDLPLMLLLSLRGKFKYINEVLGVYRLHDNGASAKHKGYDKIIVMLYIYESFNIYTNFKYQGAIRKACIYEIDRHAPGSNAERMGAVEKQNILVRGFQRIKQLIAIN